MNRAIFLRMTMILAVALVAAACARPAPMVERSFVLDLESIFSPIEHGRLDSLFLAHESSTGNEVVLVTHPTFHGLAGRDFAVAFGDSVGVGKADLDNGVVIAFSKARREVFIATGHGTERVLHDSICKRIIDTVMLPRFKEGRHSDGLWEGSLAVVEFLERPENLIAPR